MPWRAVSAATAATLVGIGIARFAYSPLLPVVIAQGWFAPDAAAYLGAANLLGYLAGAIASRRVARWGGTVPVLRGAMIAAAVSLAACSVPTPFAWFFVWRLVSGIAGGLLMILGPSSVLAHVPVERRGFASGLILTGLGMGVAASGTLVPLLLHVGLTQTWLGLAALCLALAIVTWRAWPNSPPPAPVGQGGAPTRFLVMSVSYGLCALGLVPHMVFLVDFVVRGLNRGLATGSLTWVVFGLGALCGPVIVGRLADRIGPAPTMRLVIVAQSLGLLALLAGPPHWLALGASAFIAGMLTPAIPAVMLGRVTLVAGMDGALRQRGWTQATAAWALGQAAGAYVMAWLCSVTGGYTAIFWLALAALAVASTIEAVLALQPRRVRV